MELVPGALIADRYRIDRKIGSGGMGEVWAGEHVSIGVRVALKTLLPAAALDHQIVARFRREAQLLGRLRSERVARVVDFIEDQRFGLVLVMDFVEGDSLGSVLMKRRLRIEEAIELGIDLSAALCELHRAKIVHRDLKPDNIILEPLPEGRRRAVIVDFGVSRLESGPVGDDAITGITHADMAVGTLPYMAPEQLLSASTVTGAADVYALGAILYRAISGQHVFGDPDDPDAVKRKISIEAPPLALPRFDRVAKGLAEVVARSLRRLPQERFEGAEAMLGELTSLSDVARAMNLDLDGATEQALPLSSLLDATREPDTGEETKQMPRAALVAEAILDEATYRSQGPSTDAEPPPPSPAVALTDPTPAGRATLDPPAPFSTLSIDEPPALSSPAVSQRSTRPTFVSPEPARAPRLVTLRAAVAGMIMALVAGTALGAGAHALLEKPPATRAPR